MTVSALALGLAAGFTAHYLEQRTGFFRGQFRWAQDHGLAPGCCDGARSPVLPPDPTAAVKAAGVCGCSHRPSLVERFKLKQLAQGFVELGLKRILVYFVLFIVIGRLVEMMVPAHWITLLFSGDKSYSIPLSATIGLPLYVSNAAALPLLRPLVNAGAGEGAVRAFLIAGKATGVPVIAGMSALLKPRAVPFYVGFAYLGSLVAGYVFSWVR